MRRTTPLRLVAALALALVAVGAVGWWALRGDPEPSRPPGRAEGAEAVTGVRGAGGADAGAAPTEATPPGAAGARHGQAGEVSPAEPERVRLARDLATAEETYREIRSRLAAGSRESAHHFREADRLRVVAEGIDGHRSEGPVAAYFAEGTPEQRAGKRELFSDIKDLLLLTELYAIGTAEETGELFHFAYGNRVLSDKIIAEHEWILAIDGIVEYIDMDGNNTPPFNSSAEYLLWQMGKRLDAVEDYVEHEARLASMPEEVVTAAREQLRAEVLAEMNEAFAALAVITEVNDLKSLIGYLQGQLGGL